MILPSARGRRPEEQPEAVKFILEAKTDSVAKAKTKVTALLISLDGSAD